MATILVGGVVLLIVGGIVWKMVSDRRHGKHSCSGNCQSCHMSCGTNAR